MSRKGIQVSQHGSEATEHGGRMEKTMRAKKKKPQTHWREPQEQALHWEGGRRHLLCTMGEPCSALRVDSTELLQGLLQTSRVAGL